jgi:hypothetical protein
MGSDFSIALNFISSALLTRPIEERGRNQDEIACQFDQGRARIKPICAFCYALRRGTTR